MRIAVSLLVLLLPAFAQWVELRPTSPTTLNATPPQILSGRGAWAFEAEVVYRAPSGANHKVLVQLVPSGPMGLGLRAYLTPGTPVRVSGTGPLGTLALSGRTPVASPGFWTLLQGARDVWGRLPLTLELEALGPGPLSPGYLFLQVNLVIMPE